MKSEFCRLDWDLEHTPGADRVAKACIRWPLVRKVSQLVTFKRASDVPVCPVAEGWDTGHI